MKNKMILQEENDREASISNISYIYECDSQRECIDYCKWLIDWMCLDINKYI